MSDDKIILDEGSISEILKRNAITESDEDIEITECFITDDGKIVSESDLAKSVIKKSMKCFDSDRIHTETRNSGLIDIAKSVEGSTQSLSEIGAGDSLGAIQVVEPPNPPELLEFFLQVDETHYRSVRTKVTDSIGRDFVLEPVQLMDGSPFDSAQITTEEKNRINEEMKEIRTFILESNEIIGFDGVLERVAMDHEAIGWGAIEVIRSADMKVVKLAQIPAQRVKVLRGWKGFVETLSSGQFRYYQNFGEKVVNPKRPNPITRKPSPYMPRLDGDINPRKLSWNMIDRDNGEPTKKFANSANELLWIPKHHIGTIYYGIPDIVPGLGNVLANINIRDYTLQFFDYNTVPRYAVIIKGAKMANDVKKAIAEFFHTHVKGQPHKTLIVPIPSSRGEVEVEFVKLEADATEGSFQETRKNNAQGILVAHGMSPAIIGIADVANLGSGKGLSQAEIYKDRIVTPLQRRWATGINRIFRQGLGIRMVALKFNPLDIRDREAEKDILTEYQKNGDLSINEVRKKANLGDSFEGGDRPFVVTRTGIIFVDELGMAESQEKEAMRVEMEELKNELNSRFVKKESNGKNRIKKVSKSK